MRPEFLLPETTVRTAGTGPAIDLGPQRGKTLFLTLGITRSVEKESIEVGIWGSPDASDWGSAPIASYSRKFYCGVYQTQLDLRNLPDIKYLRAQWEVNRWSRTAGKPVFTVYVSIETTDRQLALAGA